MNISNEDMEYLKGLTVLYVEDEEDAREQFTRFLQTRVGGVMVAQNGAEGVDLHDRFHPQIIITDIQMPVMDGLQMVREIRALDRNVPIILLTAFEEIEYLKKAIETGVYKYLTKPIDGFKLQEALVECAHRLMKDELLRYSERTDPVTGLINRWELTNRFEAEKSRSENYGSSFSLILADIDKFHELNDQYGQAAGDRILKTVADMINSVIHPEDICGRLENDRFLIILTHKDLESCKETASLLLESLERVSVRCEDADIAVTMSIGAGTFTPGMSMYQCMRSLNNALHKAKAAGRSRIAVAMPPRATP